jgi:chondroitin AC lyase
MHMRSNKNIINFKTKRFKFTVTIVLLLTGSTLFAMEYDYVSLISRIQQDARTGIKDVGTIDSWISTQRTDGSWQNFSYGKLTTANAVNTTDNHVLRIWHMAATVSQKGHSRYNSETYKNAIKKGLSFWYTSNTSDPNWWFNRIYFPQKLGEILLFMREFQGFIPAATDAGVDEPEIISLFQPQAIADITAHGTGANAIDIGLHYVYRGILTSNSSLLENTRNRLELILTENIQSDGVFHDHGPQIQISSYGWVFADGIIRLASYLAGSPAAFDVNSENFAKVIGFIRDTQISSIRGTSWDFSVMGRAVSRVNALNAGLNYIQKLADIIDTENSQTYRDALDRMKGNKSANYQVREFNKHYWASDYTQHARSGYLFTVRNVSTRTVEAETGNGENLKANYFSYGANFISVDGNEYKNIMPVWDWCMIPGTTFPYTTQYPARTAWGFNYGTTTFVGGVSDGSYGAAVLDMNKSGLQAKKSWFFFDNEVVCLGAGISDNSNRNVRTTLNQAKMESPGYYTEKGSNTEKMQSVSSTIYSNNQLSYLRNGKIAYFFPEQGNVKYTMKSQSGSWSSINTGGSTNTESAYVFTVWFDHGENPANASYSYIVVPGIDTQEKAQAYNANAIQIMANTASVQAVYNQVQDIIQIIFHQPGSISYANRTITVSKPCALMIRNGSYVTVSDPAGANPTISVNIQVQGVNYHKFISLPGNELSGSSVTADFGIPTGTDITRIDETDEIRCFPVPVNNGTLYINATQGGKWRSEIRNLSGQLIHDDEFSNHTTLNIQNQPDGFYFLSVYNNQKLYYKKIYKK